MFKITSVGHLMFLLDRPALTGQVKQLHCSDPGLGLVVLF